MDRLGTIEANTVRRQIVQLLATEALGVRELSQELHRTEKEIYTHLDHIGRSLKATGRQLVIEPSVCLNCGFVFAARKRLQPPGHCPSCRKTRIRRPRYAIA